MGKSAGEPYVLVVEDNKDVQELLATAMEVAGIDVRTADNGAEARALLEAHPPPRVVFTDVRMPVMDGIELARWKAGVPGLRAVPLILMSGYVSGPHKLSDVQFNAFISKPYDVNVLVKLAQGYCNQAPC